MKKQAYYTTIVLSIGLALLSEYTNNFSLFKFLKPFTTILIIGIPLLFGHPNHKSYNRTLVAALIFCLAGDVFLLNEAYFVFGLASFLIGHLLFTYGFVSLFGFGKNLNPLIVLGAFAGSYFYFIASNLGELLIPVFIYILAIVLMNWQAICLYLRVKRNVYLMLGIGATLFTLSDAVIAFNKFVQPFEAAGVIILSCYWVGIFLISNSTCANHSSTTFK